MLLPPNVEFLVKSTYNHGNGLTEVQCIQLEETEPLMDFSTKAPA